MRNLEKLSEAEKGLDPQQRKNFIDAFLGAIAHLSKPEDWEEAIKTARGLVTRG